MTVYYIIRLFTAGLGMLMVNHLILLKDTENMAHR